MALDRTAISALNLLDHQGVDWQRVQRTAYLVHQHLRYEYPGPIRDLHQRLVIVPPDQHGDQRRVVHHIEVSSPHYETSNRQDEFGNLVVSVFVPHVEQAIDFEAWIVVERNASQEAQRLPGSSLRDQRLLEPSRLTRPGPLLRQVALEVVATGDTGFALADRINTLVYQTLTYGHGFTGISTTAEEALALRSGVCQDYAHIMVALCRLCGIAARYVSGHLLGEGGTHAWVEVLLPAANPDEAVVWPFDPTHGRRAGLSYLTIAVGRDYADVAPTSGTFTASYGGQLSARKHVNLTAVEYSSHGEGAA